MDQLGQNFQNMNLQNGAPSQQQGQPQMGQMGQPMGYDYSQQQGYAAGAVGAAGAPYGGQGQMGPGYDATGTNVAGAGAVAQPNMGGYGYGAGAGVGVGVGGAGVGGVGVGVGGVAATPALPLNRIYTTDLLKNLPPPISDLALPPPPIILPAGDCVVESTDRTNAAPGYLRSTLNVVPSNHSLLKKSKLPFALCIRPYAALRDEDEPVAVALDTVIARCRRCRGYINPYVKFLDLKKWRCNFCNLLNDVPSVYDYDDSTQQLIDRYSRIELNNAVVEVVAPKEYMARVPPPLVYCFFIDVSAEAVASGMTATVANTILTNLDSIPNKNETTKVCIVGVDSALHFFKFREGLSEAPEHLIVSDLEMPYAPAPSGLSVNLAENRKAIEQLLFSFAGYFENTANPHFALGPALKFGYLMLESQGGKMMVFSSTLPSIGEGKLSIRDDANITTKSKELLALMKAGDKFYKAFAVQCSTSQIAVDLFLTGSKYQDVASLSNLLRYTAGQTHFYPSWKSHQPEDVKKLSKEISKQLSMESAMEAVMRVRCSTGFRTSQFYGNFFNRSSDLCSFPTFPRDQGYVIEISIEENIPKPVVYFQAAVLHTTCFGQRRIRIITLALPTSSKLEDIYASADQLAITNYLTHMAIAKALDGSLPTARDFLTKSVVDYLSVYRKELISGHSPGLSPLQISTNLRMLPLLLFALTKHTAFREEKVPADHRAIALNNLGSWPLDQLIQSLYPSVYSLHDMTAECGFAEKLVQVNPETGEEEVVDGELLLPEPINDSRTRMEKWGLYLIDTGSELFLWVAGEVVPDLVMDLFGVQHPLEIPIGKQELPVFEPVEDFEFNHRVRNIINHLSESKSSIAYKTLYVVVGPSAAEPITMTQSRDLMSLRTWALSFMVEDQSPSTSDYREFLTSLNSRVTA